MYIQNVIRFLETGTYIKSNSAYITCYTAIIKLCDEHDKSKEVYEFYQKKITNFITEKILPKL